MFNQIPSDEVIQKTIEALKSNNVEAEVVENREQAKEKVLSFLPKGAEVMTMTSRTLDSLNILDDINESGKYNSIRKKLMSLNRETDSLQMQKLGSAPEWTIGSVHAVTEDGKVIVASNTGSQLPAYVYGSAHVIWVVGAQKIVKDFDEGLKRIYDYVLPLESERLNKQYNMTMGSFVSKLLVVNREFMKKRITLIFVKEVLGF